MFIAALFFIAKNWKKLRCSSMGKRLNKLWHIQTMEYYSAIKKKRTTMECQLKLKHFF